MVATEVYPTIPIEEKQKQILGWYENSTEKKIPEKEWVQNHDIWKLWYEEINCF